ncbi:haloacid dehalogenase [Vulcanimicrobium alpinum]|uniref:Haloacid dehalogenase n=1 Tax=Vulcanimicrobium alpinum TaxID=3016050 RepID=A0AAN1XX59_UNVUL|nr:haloacid dehalogenase type II [Vulcanimicrobium alpinum]BDE06580.1 haloacid dehalogenase [Vulcanimicrobium alpinum]
MHIAAVCFDLYGTLLDIGGMASSFAAAGVPDAPAFVGDWRRKQLEYAFLSSLAQAYRDFDDVSALALEFVSEQRGVALDVATRATLLQTVRLMPPHPDAVPALTRLRGRTMPLAVLTNGVPASARDALRHAGLLPLLDDVLCVDAVRAYKPDPRVYALATARFACTPREIVFVSSNAWDAWGASHFGFRVAWCNRSRATPERLTPAPEIALAGLHDLEAFVTAP